VADLCRLRELGKKSFASTGAIFCRVETSEEEMKLRTIVLVACIGIAAPFASGCAITAESGEQQAGPVGTVEMQLGAVAPSGAAYRLRSANFTVTDASGVVVTTLHSEDADPDAQSISAELPAGTFTITLLDGWYMQRQSGEAVDAALITAASRAVVISDSSTTPVQYSFKVEGEPITFSGTLDVSIRVGECRQDPFEPNDTQDTAAVLSTGTFFFDFVPVTASVCGEDDWYTFTLSSVTAGTLVDLNLDFVHANGDLDMRLFQPDGSSVVSQGVTNNEHLQIAAQAGDYHLRIYGFNGAVGDYTFDMALAPTP
jgi:hypothetical protein